MSKLIQTQIREVNSGPPEIVGLGSLKPDAVNTNGPANQETGSDPKRGKAVVPQQHNSEK